MTRRLTVNLQTPVLCYTRYHYRSILSVAYFIDCLLSLYLNHGIWCHNDTVTWVERLKLAVGYTKLRQVTRNTIVITLDSGEGGWTLKYNYRGADKSLARPGRKQATATEDSDVHIAYL